VTTSRAPFRYVPWFARDVARFPGLVYLLLAIGLGYLDWRITLRFGLPRGATGVSVEHMLQVQVWNASLTVAVLFAIGGVIGIDLQRGYYRSLFSKPMSPHWYYLQRYLIGAVALLLVPFVFGAVLAVLLHTGFGIDGHLLATIALGYLLTGSACFLLGNFRPEAWLFVFLLVVAQNMMANLLQGMTRANIDAPALMVWLHRLLPPFNLIATADAPLSGGPLWHVVIYGVAMLVAALLLLRFRPLGRGGRS
jgi:hypothetical protein